MSTNRRLDDLERRLGGDDGRFTFRVVVPRQQEGRNRPHRTLR